MERVDIEVRGNVCYMTADALERLKRLKRLPPPSPRESVAPWDLSGLTVVVAPWLPRFERRKSPRRLRWEQRVREAKHREAVDRMRRGAETLRLLAPLPVPKDDEFPIRPMLSAKRNNHYGDPLFYGFAR
ncbi:MAG TPA: hypothetical protein VGN72_01250 [Tepidisphaeraceae bacterium]|jgi:hypothetical protein|nr:hypothetical protein [Tepidisphaeraceae bacterium]